VAEAYFSHRSWHNFSWILYNELHITSKYSPRDSDP